MVEISDPYELQSIILKEKSNAKSIGAVFTMGYLHEGHSSLIGTARNEVDIVVLTVFVNPMQFGEGEDYERYPRDIGRDRKFAKGAGADYLFTPEEGEIYPEGYSTYVDETVVSESLEGKFRPGHFKGVTTIVLKLLNITQPDVAYFGEKDAQQLMVIRKMVKDLLIPVEVKRIPTLRERDGLALSSRNTYLNKEERSEATALYRGLQNAEELFIKGERDARMIEGEVVKTLTEKKRISVEYVEVVDPETFRRVERLHDGKEFCLAVAARIGQTRLLDNIFLSNNLKPVSN